MPVSAYFDGSGIGSGTTTLAVIVAEDDAWTVFDQRWNSELTRLGIKKWHTTDALSRKGDFCQYTPAWVNDAKTALLNVVLELLSHASQVASCTVFSQDLLAVQRQFPEVSFHSLPQLCVNNTIGNLGTSPRDADTINSIKVFFDPGEPFINCLKPNWQKARKHARASRTGWAWQIASVEPVPLEQSCRTQAVDLLAWGIRNRHEYGDEYEDPNSMLIFVATIHKHYAVYLDKEALIRHYVNGETLPEANRRATYRFDSES